MSEQAGGGEGQWAGLAPHRDGFLLSFSVLLSRPGVDFQGGGTRLASLGVCASPERAGDVFMHSGKLLHSGEAITAGARFIMVGFVEAAVPGRKRGANAVLPDFPMAGGVHDYAALHKGWVDLQQEAV